MSWPGSVTFKLVAGLALALAVLILVQERNRWKATAVLRQQQVAAEKAAHSTTVAHYRAAAEQARRTDAANARRVRAEQAKISERTKDDFEDRIAAARARAGRLQQAAGAAADPGPGRAAPVPGPAAAAGRAAQAAGEDRLPRSDRLIATEQAIQLDELIKWVKRQSAVEVQPAERP